MRKALVHLTLSAFTVLAFALFATPAYAGLCLPMPGAEPIKPSNGQIKDFIRIEDGRGLFVDYHLPAKGKPTLVLLNGLTYRIGCWDDFVAALEGSGLGVLRYDPMGHGETLIKHGPVRGPIAYQDQVKDLRLLLNKLKIFEPVHLVGLSYGGAIGMEFAKEYPDRVATLIMMAPFLAALESQDMYIRMKIAQTRMAFPLNSATDDELYDYFLHRIILTTYGASEPIVLEHPYKLEATFRLVQGIRKFEAKTIAHQLPVGKVHLVLAKGDQYVRNAVHDEFWNEQVPAAVRASRLYIRYSEHKIPEAFPRFSASWVKEIALGNPEISGDRTFIANPYRGTAVSESVTLDNLTKE